VLDIRQLREQRDVVVAALASRGDDFSGRVDRIVELDDARRRALTEVNDLKAQRNAVSREVGDRKRAGLDADELIVEMRRVGDEIDALDHQAREAEIELEALLLELPNLPLPDVPVGDESANHIDHVSGQKASFDFTPRPHWELGEQLGILDLAGGAGVSGSGFTVLVGAGARLQRVLIDWFLDTHTRTNGYTEVRVPYLVTRETMTGTGQLPKFAEDSYHIERDDLWLIPTAEVPVTNLKRGSLLSADDLPVKLTAYSPCFRREAGSAGKDTRGLLRVHQFDKVEVVRYEKPEHSLEALEALTAEAESLLTQLGLHWRRVCLASGDLGFSSAKTYDLEVWAPGVEQWLEVSSCSVFTDFQARRADLRFRPAAAEKPQFVHTLNGSALALPRVVAALLETHQQADGSIQLPPVLQERFGAKRIEAPSDF
jgi:seryl-tRNA synthetase